MAMARPIGEDRWAMSGFRAARPALHADVLRVYWHLVLQQEADNARSPEYRVPSSFLLRCLHLL
jgi:hypothetical protein